MLLGPPLQLLSATVDSELLLLGSFALLLIGAEVFTNGVEWVGHEFGVSESATGSILAAVGTALPETMIPVIAIAQARFGNGSQAAADEVGVGAILGAPFMLATIAMFLVGASVLYFRGRRSHGREFHFNAESTRRDLTFFLVGYVLAFGAALVRNALVAHAVAAVLLCLYVVYVYLSLRSGDLMEGENLDDLLLGSTIQKGESPVQSLGVDTDHSSNPSKWLILLQTAIALAFIVGGAQLFVSEVEFMSNHLLNLPGAVVALLLAPLATELPEKFNSILWISRDKDTLAIGNITGAMAFQGTIPVTLGIVFTSWNLSLQWGTTGFLNGFSAVLAVVSGLLLYVRARNSDESMRPAPFLVGGLFYVVFLGVLVYHVLAFDLASAAG